EAAVSGAVYGARLSGPEVSGSMTVNYSFDWIRDSVGNASLAVVRVGDFPGSFPNVPGQPGVVSPTFDYTDAYTIVNASLAAAFERLTVGLYAENLFDDRSINYVHPEAFLDGRSGVVRPRTGGVRVGCRYRWTGQPRGRPSWACPSRLTERGRGSCWGSCASSTC